MKPLAYLDTETTGTNTTTDAIWSLGIWAPDDQWRKEWRMKPWKPLPPDVEKLCGVTNAELAKCPPFKSCAVEIYERLQSYDLAGFNIRGFDVPIIWEELYRCDIRWDLSNTLIIDHGVIFKKREERSLSAAVQFYCGFPHEGAHGALGDCVGTQFVAMGQMIRYRDLGLMSRADLATYSEYDDQPKKLTFDGKIIEIDGEAHYKFGKYFDQPGKIRDDRGLGEWMLGKDFPAQTRLVVEQLLNKYEADDRKDFEARNATKAKQKGLL